MGNNKYHVSPKQDLLKGQGHEVFNLFFVSTNIKLHCKQALTRKENILRKYMRQNVCPCSNDLSSSRIQLVSTVVYTVHCPYNYILPIHPHHQFLYPIPSPNNFTNCLYIPNSPCIPTLHPHQPQFIPTIQPLNPARKFHL